MFSLSQEKMSDMIQHISTAIVDKYDLVEFSDHVRERNWKGISLVTPCFTNVAWRYRALRQVQALVQKNEVLDMGVDTKAAALAAWWEAENRCAETNALFRNRSGVSLLPFFAVSLERARRIIRRVVGKAPLVSDLHLHFGPGATTSVKKNNASPTTKMAAGFVCSERLLHSGFLPSLIRELPQWSGALNPVYSICEDGWLVEHHSVVIDDARVTFVPKNWKTDRAICVEPTLNSVFQQGLRLWLERRMARFGIQISDQTVNQRIAREGSTDGVMATIDLSSASDTISTELVRYLLPEDWFALLNACRSDVVILEGKTVSLDKFVSMGNATTFPLETLIFYALCKAVSDGPVSVYGDDICVLSKDYDRVARILQLSGFVVNATKSYSSGAFRESCGKDYLGGIDVRPIFLKQSDILALYAFRNQICEWDDEIGKLVDKYIPREYRFYGPPRLGHMVLHSETFPSKFCRKTQSRGITCLSSDPIRRYNVYTGDWVSPLYSVYTRASEMDTCVRNGFPTFVLPGGRVIRTTIYIS